MKIAQFLGAILNNQYKNQVFNFSIIFKFENTK
jgi:hypothetical protein